ncbi:MAG: FtsX-like permease family protein [Acidimicrobiales bacterium]|jgi:putative ABC transport system permease protein
MSIELPTNRPANGGAPARRAMVRWAWRLARREWRQQLLIMALITVAVAVTVVGVGVSINTPMPVTAGFGTAHDLDTISGTVSHINSAVSSLHRRFGAVDVIENERLSIPGSIESYELRAQNPHGAFGQPMLSLLSGHLPTGSNEVALTPNVLTTLHLSIGSTWHEDGQSRRVVGTVENPENLLDEFALVAPGQVTSTSQVTVLFNAPGRSPSSIGRNVETPSSAAQANVINPDTITLALATLAMMLIGLVAVAGFTVLAQRRLRSIGMLGALGATDRNIRLVVRANGVIVGFIGAVIGFVVGFVAWLAYRPSLEASAHHSVGVFQLPWLVIVASMLLAVLASYVAAKRPARTMAAQPIVSALSGRPVPPMKSHRTAVPGVVFLVIAFLLLGYAGASGGNGGGVPELLFGFILLTVALVLLAPFVLGALPRIARRAPISVRLALRDLARYRARSGSALGAISLAVLIAVIVCVASAARFGNVLDYAGPNVTSSQLIVYTPNGPYGPGGPGNGKIQSSLTKSDLEAMAKEARSIGAALGTHTVVTLETTSASPQHAAAGRSWSGPLYVATPQLLRAFGIPSSSIEQSADVLSMRPGLSTMSHMQLVYGNYFAQGAPGRGDIVTYPCPKGECLNNPKIQQVSQLPSGTSAPNSVITQYAVRQLHLKTNIAGWFIQAAHPFSASQISEARASASTAGMYIETKSSIPSLKEIVNWATAVGVLLALGILSMTIGLIRSETASDVRVLTAVGASSRTRRTITSSTAGALALLGSVIGTVGAYIALIAFSRTSKLDGLSSLTSVPIANLLLILVVMPLAAFVGAWLLSGRQPASISQRPIE